MDIRLLLIGCGGIAQMAHLPALNELQHEGILTIAGLCDQDYDRVKKTAQKYNVPVYGTDWKELVRRCNATAVSICLPPGIGSEIAIEALANGLHVITEKPPALNALQALKMWEAEKKTNLVAMTAFNRRFATLAMRVKEEAGSMGAPHIFSAKFTRAAMGKPPSDTVGDWLTSDSIHTIDYVISTMGWPKHVQVNKKKVGSEHDNVWMINMSHQNGSSVMIFDYASSERCEKYEWYGPGYYAELIPPFYAKISISGMKENNIHIDGKMGDQCYFENFGFKEEYVHFVKAMGAATGKVETNFEYGYHLMRLIEQLLEGEKGEFERAIISEGQKSVSKEPISFHIKGEVRVVVGMSSTKAMKYLSYEHLRKLKANAKVIFSDNHDAWLEELKNADVVITGWNCFSLKAQEVSTMNKAKLVLNIGASIKALPITELRGREIAISNTARSLALSVGEHCLALTLASLRGLLACHNRIAKDRGWREGGGKIASAIITKEQNVIIKSLKRYIPSQVKLKIKKNLSCNISVSDLRGHTVGIVGWGHTARAYCQLLQPFNCKILICSKFITPEELRLFKAKEAPLAEVLGSSRVVSLHKGLTPHTENLIGEKELGLMQKNAVLINTARAELVEREALYRSLSDGKIIGAFDVFHEEPLPKKDSIRNIRNTILTPHCANQTLECYHQIGEEIVNVVMQFIAGDELNTLNLEHIQNMT